MSQELDVFEHTLEKTSQLMRNIEIELGWEKHHHQTYQILRVVLHALRDRLTVDEAANFSAQLPLLVRGIFFEGWKPERVPIKMDYSDFIERIRKESTLQVSGSLSDLVKIVMGQIFYIIDPLEQDKIKMMLPADYAELFER